MRYYVLSDLHGFCTLFLSTLREARYESYQGAKRIVLLGDLFDRGSEAVEMQDTLLRLMDENRVILIRGNHEDLFEDLVTSDHGRPLQHHVHNGTYDTLEQLTGMKGGGWGRGIKLAKAGRETPYYRTILPAMLDYYETPNYIFTHAWVPLSGGTGYRSDWRTADAADWREARWVNPMDAVRTAKGEKKTLVCGHFHCSYGHWRYESKGSEYGPDADFSPYTTKGLIAIDACTAYSRKMNCLVVDD